MYIYFSECGIREKPNGQHKGRLCTHRFHARAMREEIYAC